MIKRSFSTKTKKVILNLYEALIRPRLEYAVQAWSPHLHKDIDLLEKVQRRATKLIFGLSDKPYEERQKILYLTTLETRRVRGDLIEVFKLFKGFDKCRGCLE
jgi:ribonuclease P/MRP protein subunit RPP40